MALRSIRLEGDEILRKKSKPVREINKKILDLLDDMAETMAAQDGVGLAAPQVGMLKRIVLIDVGNGVIEMINPEIVSKEGSQKNSEGCLSIPGMLGVVERPAIVKVKYTDRNEIERELEGTEVLAIAMCHELDHLDGILYTDLTDNIYEAKSRDDDDEDDDEKDEEKDEE